MDHPLPRTFPGSAAMAVLGFHNRATFKEWLDKVKANGGDDPIRVYRPFSSRSVLYDADDVLRWARHLERRQALIALGRLPINAPKYKGWWLEVGDDIDTECPLCYHYAVEDPKDPDRMYCARCGII